MHNGMWGVTGFHLAGTLHLRMAYARVKRNGVPSEIAGGSDQFPSHLWIGVMVVDVLWSKCVEKVMAIAH